MQSLLLDSASPLNNCVILCASSPMNHSCCPRFLFYKFELPSTSEIHTSQLLSFLISLFFFFSSYFLSFCFLLFSFPSRCTRETEIKREREMRAEGEKNAERPKQREGEMKGRDKSQRKETPDLFFFPFIVLSSLPSFFFFSVLPSFFSFETERSERGISRLREIEKPGESESERENRERRDHRRFDFRWSLLEKPTERGEDRRT